MNTCGCVVIGGVVRPLAGRVLSCRHSVCFVTSLSRLDFTLPPAVTADRLPCGLPHLPSPAPSSVKCSVWNMVDYHAVDFKLPLLNICYSKISLNFVYCVCTYGSLRTVCGTSFSPMLGLLTLAASPFLYPLSRLTGLLFIFLLVLYVSSLR